MFSFLIALFGGLSGPTMEKLPVARVEQIARQVVARVQPSIQHPIKVVVVKRPEMTPVGSLTTSLNQCVIIINPQPTQWKLWGRFTEGVQPEDIDSVIEASIAHEAGHCAERAERVIQAQATQNKGTLSSLTMGTRSLEPALASELYADVYAHLYVRKYMSDRVDLIEKVWAQGRERFASSDPDHATGPYLEKALQYLDREKNEETMGTQAWRLRDLSVQTPSGVAVSPNASEARGL